MILPLASSIYTCGLWARYWPLRSKVCTVVIVFSISLLLHFILLSHSFTSWVEKHFLLTLGGSTFEHLNVPLTISFTIVLVNLSLLFGTVHNRCTILHNCMTDCRDDGKIIEGRFNRNSHRTEVRCYIIPQMTSQMKRNLRKNISNHWKRYYFNELTINEGWEFPFLYLPPNISIKNTSLQSMQLLLPWSCPVMWDLAICNIWRLIPDVWGFTWHPPFSLEMGVMKISLLRKLVDILQNLIYNLLEDLNVME